MNPAQGRPLSAAASKQGTRPASRTKKTRWKLSTCIGLKWLNAETFHLKGAVFLK